MSSFRSLPRPIARTTAEPENEFENPINSTIPFPPLTRTPLHSIQDPSQNPIDIHDTESDSRVKFESSSSSRLRRYSEKKIETLNYRTPRGKVESSSSVQSTPARSVPKVQMGSSRDVGMRGGGGGGGGGGYSRASRRISVASPNEAYTDVPHFELVEDSSFWMDHNVQVLIRIRPISTAEKFLQGNFRCLRQDSANTLTWLGNPETRFTFDHVACETISQEKLFTVAGLPMVENCMSGYNSCMFAYGQTGSGKTYTMMGEIHEMDGNLSKDCGMTPRIFEYLFKRIRAEEENRRDENLKYSCKCSFLEIYNEHITDLLEPSSTNLQLREDARKGVYVENLTEYEVNTVKDVIELLLQGAANRKMAATHMNSESSRSHSVFTCVIESRWDMDSTTHYRFGRLNLVDLAGSERQKTSGAEGDRLKEAANINKSLSTLGLVIMTLVDLAHGKQRHVPYRDSRLTFLLQDSLGGNSKTTIIANISPSTCSAHETLSTLKFAQRAKLIQNDAKVNEDASGDVMALQRQIQQLKDQLTYVLKHQEPSKSLPLCLPNSDQSQLDDFHETHFSSLSGRIPNCQNSTSIPKKKMKRIQMTLTGALRREKMAETAVRRLEAEVEHMNRLVHQREEDAQRTKMILRFREEKIKRLELLADGLVSGDEFLMEENSALYEEIHLLQARIDRNPELTRFALENIRLLEQLRMYEDFYEQGERETLLNEISELRDQFMDALEVNNQQLEVSSIVENQDKDSIKELEDCRKNLEACLQVNEHLTREVDELQRELNKYLNSSEAAFDSVTDSLSRDAETIKQADKHSSVEITSVRTDLDDEITSYTREEDEVLKVKNDQKMGETLAMQLSETERELTEARILIEAMESEQIRLIEELDILRKENYQYMELFRNEDFGHLESMLQQENQCQPSERYRRTEDSGQPDGLLIMEDNIADSILQSKLDRMNKDLEEARTLIRRYQDDQASQLFHEDEVEQVRQQVEVEMANTILHLQDNLTTLQQELQERLCAMTEENKRLRNTIASREDEMKALAEEWEKATLELTTFILDGSRSLEDASNQIGIIAGSFPERNYWISEHVEKAARAFIEKETTIKQLRRSLEDAHKMGLDMELKLSSLKGATLAITDVQQLENDEKHKETLQLRSLLSEKICMIQELERKLKTKEDQIIEAEKRAYAAFVVVKRLSRSPKGSHAKLTEKEISELQLDISAEQEKYRISEVRADENAQALEASEESEEGCNNSKEMLYYKLESARLAADEKINTADEFLVTLEEAQATMKEADVMLNTLLKANENAKHKTDMWKQAGRKLKLERASLIDEVQRLTATICLQQGEYESLQDHYHSRLEEMANSVSSLEMFILQMQRDVEERFKVIYSDFSSLGQDLLNCICNSRSSLEDICGEIMEKEFALFVLYQCHISGSFEKNWSRDSEAFILQHREEGCHSILNNVGERGFREEFTMLKGSKGIEQSDQSDNPGNILDLRYSLGKVAEYKEEELGLTLDNLISENDSLKKELDRKDVLLQGLLFDLSTLQESTSNSKDIKDETEQMAATLTGIRGELAMKTTQLDDILLQQRELETQLADREAALSLANSKLEEAEETQDVLSNQNAELRALVDDILAKKNDAEEQLEEKMEVIKSLEEEILRMAFSVEEKILSSIEDIEDELRTVTNERDHLREEIISLNDKLEMANALAEENEAVAVEAHQESEASKIYAEQKEEEAKILERSVEELEYTINVLEKKVYEMGEEVERHHLVKDYSTLELQDPTQKITNSEYFDVEQQRDSQMSRHLDDRILELHESENRIKVLEKERAEQAKEIKECRDYISELVLHADAQASLYHQKYNMLEAMVREVQKDPSTSAVAIPSDKMGKSSMRPRGSSSPFRCMQGLVQQMNVEKDQELSMARLRIEELEALASRQQKEVCMLNARLAAAESMTHDVIRDLLAVKLDITNYANLIDQHEVQKLVEEAQHQTEESIAKEQEIQKLRQQINDLMEERQSYIIEKNKKEADILAAQLKVEQLKERGHMLTAQNEMLKMDKTNLTRKVTEMDKMAKKPFAPHNIQQRVQQTTKMKENSSPRVANEEFSKRLMHSEKLLSNVNNELAWYRHSESRDRYSQNEEGRFGNRRQEQGHNFD